MKASRKRSYLIVAGVLVVVALASAAFVLLNLNDPASKEARFLKRGKAQMNNRDYARAVIEFQNATRAMPKDAEPYYQLALATLAQGPDLNADVQRSAGLLARAIQLNPKHTAAQLKLAALMARSSDKRDLDFAQEHVKGVLEYSPDDPRALNILGVLELRFGKIDDAIAHLEKAVDKAPGKMDAAVNLAKVKTAQHDLLGAEAVLNKLVASSPKSVPPLLALAHFYIQTGRKAEALAQVQKARQLDGQNPDALLLLGAMQIDAGRQDQAERTYGELSALSGSEFRPVHALFLYQEGKRREAVSELERLGKQYPGDRDVRNLLVSAYVGQGQNAEAEKLLDAALKRNKKDVDALLMRAEIYIHGGKYKEAEADLNTVLHFRPTSGEAHYTLGRIYGLAGEELRQRQEFGEAIRLAPNLFAARAAFAKSLLRSHDAKGALDLLDRAPQEQKRTAQYAIARNWVLLALGSKPEARKGIDLALAGGRSPEPLYQDALLRINEKDYQGGRHSLEEILKKLPDSTQAVDLLASSYAAQNDLREGLDVIRGYAAQRPQSAPLQTTVGIWLAKGGKRDEARAAFTKALSADPNYRDPAVALAEMDFQDGNLEGARRGFSQIVAGYPDNVHARLVLALVEEKTGDHAGAIEQFRAVLKVDSRNFEALNNLAFLLARDHPDEALKYAQSAVEFTPDSADAQDTLGWIYYLRGDYRGALNYLRRSVDKKPTATAQYHLGLAYTKLGDVNLGRHNIEAALKRDPKLPISESIDK